MGKKLKALKRGFKTVHSLRNPLSKGNRAARLAKNLKRTRGVRIRNLAIQRAAVKRTARRLLK